MEQWETLVRREAELALNSMQFQKAARLLSRLLEAHPDDRDARANLSTCYTLLGDQKKALAILPDGAEDGWDVKIAKDQALLSGQIADEIIRKKHFEDVFPDEMSSLDRRLSVEWFAGFVLAMYRTAQKIFSTHKDLPRDTKWILLIYSRVKMINWGLPTPDIDAPESTQERFAAIKDEMACNDPPERLAMLKGDLANMGMDWEQMSLQEQFVEVCSSVLAIESYDLGPPMPTALCKSMLEEAICPVVFRHVPWEL